MEKNILIIDDEANKGWKEILKYIFFTNDNVEAVINLNNAEEKITSKRYDLIFLDLRFGEKDHKANNLKDFAGFSLIRKIRDEFLSINFSTPVILFTASNKAWYINQMLDSGCDDYYIKEHPDTAYDESFTRDNTKRLKNTVYRLIDIGAKRNLIWHKACTIIQNIDHTVPKKIIRTRIQEKLKIGFGLIFNRVTSFEKENLLYNNEILAYIVFWSTLEELSHSHYNRTDTFEKEWVLRYSKKKIQYLDNDNKLTSGFKTIRDEFNTFVEIKNDDNSHQVNLSLQISAILRYDLKWSYNDINLKFGQKLNSYRNKIDFIHSDTQTINTTIISKEYDGKEAFNKCNQILDFVEVLSNKDNFR